MNILRALLDQGLIDRIEVFFILFEKTVTAQSLVGITGHITDMASRNPAQLYGLDDRGEISPGKRADLILFTLENGMLRIQQTLIAGDVVYER